MMFDLLVKGGERVPFTIQTTFHHKNSSNDSWLRGFGERVKGFFRKLPSVYRKNIFILLSTSKSPYYFFSYYR